MSVNEEIKIEECTIKHIDKNFNIPIYQRPYAWGIKEVEVLLEDFYNAFNKNKDDYYIGNIVTFPNDKKLDVVDGQQRFTTLFLIGIIVGWDKNINLDYEIREADGEFLKTIKIDSISKEHKDINNNLIENLRFIDKFFSEKDSEDFTNWIFTNVKFVITELSPYIDVNKYFEVMNDRGVQLEKHHILKAKLLEKITDKKEQKQYAKIWDYCSDMNVYLEEYILKDEDNEGTIKKVRKGLLGESPMKQFNGDNFTEENLLDIIQKNDTKEIENTIAKESKKTEYKSIVSFETFLLHVYKIDKKDNRIKINDSDLLAIIEVDDLNAENFIETMLEYRILFDYFIFKRDKEQKAYLRLINADGSIKTDNNLLMIELLFEITSSKFNLWLTEFLKFVKDNKDKNCFANKLEEIDKREALERKGDKDFENLLNQGTSTPHYWFHKLDYLLWKKFSKTDKGIWKDVKPLKKANIKDFRLKNVGSIEHIYPQQPLEECKNWDESDCNLNNFGNLALISDYMNSKLSNQCFKNKKSDIEKQVGNGTMESLKMLLIYSKYSDWNIQNCKEHQEEMINILEESLR